MKVVFYFSFFIYFFTAAASVLVKGDDLERQQVTGLKVSGYMW